MRGEREAYECRYPLVASDLDGTLLDPQGDNSARTGAAVAALRAMGVTLALATARRWTGAAPVAAALGLTDAPVIVYDGAQIRHYPSGEILASQPISAATAQSVAEILTAHELQPIAQQSDATGEHLYASDAPAHPEWAARYLANFTAQTTFLPLAALCRDQPDPIRMVAFGPLARVRRAAVAIAALGCGRQLLLTGNYGMAELTLFARTASKGSALATLSARLEIPLAQTVAIGDGVNDASMLRTAGLGVAMAHAPRKIRALATATTSTNADDGFALALERYILRREPFIPRRESHP
jgi:Cof subfamily protein (haloacid dehalogenase superfamily)